MDKHIPKGVFATGPGTHATKEVSAPVKQHVRGRKTATMHLALAGHLSLTCAQPSRQERQRLCAQNTYLAGVPGRVSHRAGGVCGERGTHHMSWHSTDDTGRKGTAQEGAN